MGLGKINACLGLTSSADAFLTVGNRLIILLAAVSTITEIPAGLDAALIENHIPAGTSIDAGLPKPVMCPAEFFQKAGEFFLPRGDIQHLPPGMGINTLARPAPRVPEPEPPAAPQERVERQRLRDMFD